MQDDNWEMISGEAAHEIEILNYSNQVNVIAALVHLLMFHHRGHDGTCLGHPNETVLREFHRTATLFLLHEPGQFRDCPVEVRKGSEVIHTPPPAEDVVEHIERFFTHLATEWAVKPAEDIGAYCLWMINWIHPFKNGNGRTARAFCYACLCLKLGFVLPGDKTVIDMIMEQRADYYSALKVADLAFAANGEPDLEPMIEFVDRLLYDQLTSIPGL